MHILLAVLTCVVNLDAIKKVVMIETFCVFRILKLLNFAASAKLRLLRVKITFGNPSFDPHRVIRYTVEILWL